MVMAVAIMTSMGGFPIAAEDTIITTEAIDATATSETTTETTTEEPTTETPSTTDCIPPNIPDDPDKEDTYSTKEVKSSAKNNNIARTGDDNPLKSLGILMIITGGMSVLIIRRKRY